MRGASTYHEYSAVLERVMSAAEIIMGMPARNMGTYVRLYTIRRGCVLAWRPGFDHVREEEPAALPLAELELTRP